MVILHEEAGARADFPREQNQGENPESPTPKTQCSGFLKINTVHVMCHCRGTAGALRGRRTTSWSQSLIPTLYELQGSDSGRQLESRRLPTTPSYRPPNLRLGAVLQLLAARVVLTASPEVRCGHLSTHYTSKPHSTVNKQRCWASRDSVLETRRHALPDLTLTSRGPQSSGLFPS